MSDESLASVVRMLCPDAVAVADKLIDATRKMKNYVGPLPTTEPIVCGTNDPTKPWLLWAAVGVLMSRGYSNVVLMVQIDQTTTAIQLPGLGSM